MLRKQIIKNKLSTKILFKDLTCVGYKCSNTNIWKTVKEIKWQEVGRSGRRDLVFKNSDASTWLRGTKEK